MTLPNVELQSYHGNTYSCHRGEIKYSHFDQTIVSTCVELNQQMKMRIENYQESMFQRDVHSNAPT